MRFFQSNLTRNAALVAVAVIGAAAGCDNKEKVLDIETNDGGVEVERDKDTGEVEVDVDG